MVHIKMPKKKSKKKSKKKYTPKKSPMTGLEFNEKYWDKKMWNMP